MKDAPTFFAAAAPALALPFVTVVLAGAVDGRTSSSTSTLTGFGGAADLAATGAALAVAGGAFWGRLSLVFSRRGTTWSLEEVYNMH